MITISYLHVQSFKIIDDDSREILNEKLLKHEPIGYLGKKSSTSRNPNYYSSGFTVSQKCESAREYSIFSNHIIVTSDNPLKHQILKEFFCVKFFQHFDTINYLTIDGIPHMSVDFPKILELPTYDDEIFNQSSSRSCYLDITKGKNLIEQLFLCPWYWAIIMRKDRYPFELPVAKCTCQNCQVFTKFDSDKVQRSQCIENYSPKPVLVRELNEQIGQEVWTFSLEKVPISCSCSIMLNLF